MNKDRKSKGGPVNVPPKSSATKQAFTKSQPVGKQATISNKVSKMAAQKAVTASIPKPAKMVAFSDVFHERHNSYWNSLKDPSHVRGAKIPDVDFQSSGTIAVVERNSITVGSNGVGGVVTGVVSPATLYSFSYPSYVACGFGNNTTYTWVAGATTNSAATANNPFSTASGSSGVIPWQWRSWCTAGSTSSASTGPIPANCDQIRLVSAELVVEPTASATANGGYFVGVVLPQGFISSELNADSLSVSDYSNLPGAVTSAIAQGPVRLKYAPTDNQSLIYVDTDKTPGGDAENISDRNPMTFVVLCNGATVGSTLLVSLYMNYEFLPRSGTAMFGISPSMVDRESLDYAMTKIQTEDLVDVPEFVDHTDDSEVFQETFPNSSAMFGAKQRVVAKIARRRVKSQARKVVESEEKPLFEHVLDDLGSIVKSVAPSLLALL